MDITNIPRVSDRDVPYPIFIRECRYQGLYSGGQWNLVAGSYRPDEETEAWGSDCECNSFWNDRDSDPEFEIVLNPPAGKRVEEGYAASGNDPTKLIEEMFEYYG